MEHVIPYCHRLLSAYSRETSHCVDFTAGNGNDTLFLARLCPRGSVIGFDIQPEAIETTTELLKKNNIKNVTLILDSHEYLSKYLNETFDLGVFNLGYLPNGNQQIITQVSSTIAALTAALKWLNSHGLLVIVCYISHPGGRDEATAVETFIAKLDDNDFICTKYEFMNKATAPFVLAIEKR